MLSPIWGQLGGGGGGAGICQAINLQIKESGYNPGTGQIRTRVDLLA